MTVFTEQEVAFLRSQRLGRLATVDSANRPHVVPTTFGVDVERAVIEIGAKVLSHRGQRRSYRTHIETNPHIAFVVDDLGTTGRWEPRGISILGRAEILLEGGERLASGFGPVWVRITPTRILSWGIETGSYEPANRRDIG